LTVADGQKELVRLLKLGLGLESGWLLESSTIVGKEYFVSPIEKTLL